MGKFHNKYNAARPKNLVKKRPKGIKKETTNIYQPHSISLYFPSEKQTNQSKKHPFFVITQKKIKAHFFVTSLKKKKLLSKNLCHSIPKRFNLNTTVPLYEYLPSLYTVHRMGQRNWSSLENSNIYVPNGTFHVFYCTICTFPIKTFYVSIAFCHKIIFFLLALVK